MRGGPVVVASSAESCIRKAAIERVLTPGPAGLADVQVEQSTPAVGRKRPEWKREVAHGNRLARPWFTPWGGLSGTCGSVPKANKAGP